LNGGGIVNFDLRFRVLDTLLRSQSYAGQADFAVRSTLLVYPERSRIRCTLLLY